MKKFLIFIFTALVSPSMSLLVLAAFIIGDIIESRRQKKAYRRAEAIRAEKARKESALKAEADRERTANRERKESERLAKEEARAEKEAQREADREARQAEQEEKAARLHEIKLAKAVGVIDHYEPILDTYRTMFDRARAAYDEAIKTGKGEEIIEKASKRLLDVSEKIYRVECKIEAARHIVDGDYYEEY